MMATPRKVLEELGDDELAALAERIVSRVPWSSRDVISEVILRWQLLRGAGHPSSPLHRES
jgi:hypothetical protein